MKITEGMRLLEEANLLADLEDRLLNRISVEWRAARTPEEREQKHADSRAVSRIIGEMRALSRG